MRDRDPAEHLGEFAIMPRPQKEMPMIGHEAIGCDANLGLSVGLSENFLKRGVVRRLLEQLKSADTPIQEARSPAARRGRRGMAGLVSKQPFASQKKTPDPFSYPRPLSYP